MARSGSILGHPVMRKEDPGILTGQTRYFDDLPVERVAHVAFVRSTVAHATITGVDTADAAAAPGVLAVYAAADLDLADQHGFILLPPTMNRPVLARDKVRFVGDIVAAVVAETRSGAIDAAELVVVDYDPLPAVTDPEAALAEGAPVIHADHGSNLAFETATPEPPDLFEGADVVVRGRFLNQRLAPVTMEANGIVVVPGEPEGGFTAWVPTQGPHGVRGGLAGAFGLDRDAVRVVAPAVGGGFGAKNGVFSEYLVVAAAALRLGRPVKWTETRSENMLSMTHGRAQIQDVELGLRRDGTFVGLRADLIGDAGAYPAIGAFLLGMTQLMAQGPYRIPRLAFRGRAAVTNTTTVAAYRGAGRPEAACLLERIVGMAAAELDIDPAELRRRNFLAPDEFPYTTVTGARYDVGDYARALDAALEVAGYDELRARQRARRESGATRLLGIGVAAYIEVTAMASGREYGAVEVHDDGTVTATVGTSAHGQGHETAFAMLVSEVLGVPLEDVRLVQSDTALVPRGSGTMGSRSLQTGGSAVHAASEVVLDKARQLAAHLLEASPDDIVVGDGGLEVAGVPASRLGWAELAAAAADDSRRPPDLEPGLAHALDFDQSDSTYPFGAHVAVVEVDTETGRVELLRHVAIDDCGRILNPLLVAGQQHGGIAQGVAQALFEEVCYDDDGNPVTANLLDYAIPSAAEFPSFEVGNTVTPTPLNPLGAKGIGESGTTGATPAVHNAVVDALAHLGVRHIDMPLTPERVWNAVRKARGA